MKRRRPVRWSTLNLRSTLDALQGYVVAEVLPGGVPSSPCRLIDDALWRTDADGYPEAIQVGPGRRRAKPHRRLLELAAGRTLSPNEHGGHLCHDRAAGRGLCAGGTGCSHRRCINLAHLAIQTPGENVTGSAVDLAGVNARKSECIHGHPFDDANTLIRKNGDRECRACMADRSRRYRKATR